jgi:TRL-like protein family
VISTLRIFAGLVMFVVFGTGCYMRSPVLVPPPIGIGFTGIGVPVDTTFDQTELAGTRIGRSTSHCMFGLFAWGDASVDAAARKAGLKVVEQVDAEVQVIFLGMYSSYEIVVSGR